MCSRLQVEKATGWIVQRGVPVPTVVRWLARDEPFKMRMLEGIDVEELSWWVAAKRFGFPQVRRIPVLNPHGSFAGRRGCGYAIALKRGDVRAFGEAVMSVRVTFGMLRTRLSVDRAQKLTYLSLQLNPGSDTSDVVEDEVAI